jgi:hypothetical protein
VGEYVEEAMTMSYKNRLIAFVVSFPKVNLPIVHSDAPFFSQIIFENGCEHIHTRFRDDA